MQAPLFESDLLLQINLLIELVEARFPVLSAVVAAGIFALQLDLCLFSVVVDVVQRTVDQDLSADASHPQILSQRQDGIAREWQLTEAAMYCAHVNTVHRRKAPVRRNDALSSEVHTAQEVAQAKRHCCTVHARKEG